jgi:hypothetical protein
VAVLSMSKQEFGRLDVRQSRKVDMVVTGTKRR